MTMQCDDVAAVYIYRVIIKYIQSVLVKKLWYISFKLVQ